MLWPHSWPMESKTLGMRPSSLYLNRPPSESYSPVQWFAHFSVSESLHWGIGFGSWQHFTSEQLFPWCKVTIKKSWLESKTVPGKLEKMVHFFNIHQQKISQKKQGKWVTERPQVITLNSIYLLRKCCTIHICLLTVLLVNQNQEYSL